MQKHWILGKARACQNFLHETVVYVTFNYDYKNKLNELLIDIITIHSFMVIGVIK